MNLKLLSILAGALVATQAAAESLRTADPALANGHWECHCGCMIGLVNIADAELDGKCEDDTEGTACRAPDGREGELGFCSNVFVIDE